MLARRERRACNRLEGWKKGKTKRCPRTVALREKKIQTGRQAFPRSKDETHRPTAVVFAGPDAIETILSTEKAVLRKGSLEQGFEACFWSGLVRYGMVWSWPPQTKLLFFFSKSVQISESKLFLLFTPLTPLTLLLRKVAYLPLKSQCS